jgi:hypothetical protein
MMKRTVALISLAVVTGCGTNLPDGSGITPELRRLCIGPLSEDDLTYIIRLVESDRDYGYSRSEEVYAALDVCGGSIGCNECIVAVVDSVYK